MLPPKIKIACTVSHTISDCGGSEKLRIWGQKGWKTGSYSVCGKLPSQHSGQMFVDEIIFTDLHDSARQWEAISGLLSCKKTCHVSFISTSGSHRPSKVSSFGGLLYDFDSIVVVKSLPEKPCSNSDKLYFAPPPEMAGEKFGLDRFWSVTSCFSEEGSRDEEMRWEERRRHLLWMWEQTRESMGVMERRCEGGQEESGRGGGIWSEQSFLKKWLNQTWMNGWKPRGFRVQETVNNISRALRISSKIK